MWLSIYNNRSGEEYLRQLGPNASLDLRDYVRQWAADISDGDLAPSFSEPGSHITNGCADWQAEIRRTKAESGSCWTSEPFYLESADGKESADG